MQILAAGVPPLDIDPFAEDVLSDPRSMHRAVRETGPVVFLPRYGIFATARYAQVREVFLDPDRYCSGAGVGLADLSIRDPWRPPSLLVESDPPEHTRARQAIMSVLTMATVRSWREHLTEEADALVDGIVQGECFDAMHDFAQAFPLTAFADLIGLPKEGRYENLLPYGEMIGNAFGPCNDLFQRSTERAAHVREWIESCCRPERLSPGGFGMRVYESARAAGYPDESSALLVRSVLSAGIDTTVNAMGNAMLAFAQNPEVWASLRADLSLARAAFDEAVRYDTPLQNFFRTTTVDVELGGFEIPAGRKVLLFLGAANRDPEHYRDPDVFDITRGSVDHVGFGFGIHHCIGRAVARLEGEILLTALAKRARTITVNGKMERLLNHTIRGLRYLPMKIEPA